MRNIKLSGMSWLVSLALVFGAAGLLKAESELDFTLVNKTGYDIKKMFIAPSSQEEWSDDDAVKLPGVIKDDSSVDLSFSPKAKAEKWDMKIIWVDGGDAVEWHNFNLTEISKITLHYDEKTDKTTAETE